MTLLDSLRMVRESHLIGGLLWMDVDKARGSAALAMTPPKSSASGGGKRKRKEDGRSNRDWVRFLFTKTKPTV